MAFLTPTQMKTHMEPGISNAISQGDASLLQSAIDAAIMEAKGYCSRYRVEQLFDNVDAVVGWVADPTLMMYVKNIAKWHFINIGNQNIDYEVAQARYDQAISWLKSIQSGKAVPVNWPPKTPDGKETFFHMSSNTKRKNHFN
jgi:phage gp36-like protein